MSEAPVSPIPSAASQGAPRVRKCSGKAGGRSLVRRSSAPEGPIARFFRDGDVSGPRLLPHVLNLPRLRDDLPQLGVDGRRLLAVHALTGLCAEQHRAGHLELPAQLRQGGLRAGHAHLVDGDLLHALHKLPLHLFPHQGSRICNLLQARQLERLLSDVTTQSNRSSLRVLQLRLDLVELCFRLLDDGFVAGPGVSRRTP
mmetsp:Transcript_62384/g.203595  ORF Transcript_62384/g.203595 Transcript_62384/m.203595 type:complete len:200 (-) Transcript_62384:358-957(-)